MVISESRRPSIYYAFFFPFRENHPSSWESTTRLSANNGRGDLDRSRHPLQDRRPKKNTHPQNWESAALDDLGRFTLNRSHRYRIWPFSVLAAHHYIYVGVNEPRRTAVATSKSRQAAGTSSSPKELHNMPSNLTRPVAASYSMPSNLRTQSSRNAAEREATKFLAANDNTPPKGREPVYRGGRPAFNWAAKEDRYGAACLWLIARQRLPDSVVAANDNEPSRGGLDTQLAVSRRPRLTSATISACRRCCQGLAMRSPSPSSHAAILGTIYCRRMWWTGFRTTS